MASVVISGDTSGSVTITAPAVAGTPTLTLPTTTGTLATLTTPSFGTTIGVGGATASASGSGISFPATQSASSDANTLDDYEEGTWTPTASPASGSYTTLTTGGWYVKTGRSVTIFGYWYIVNAGTAGSNLNVGGLPFTILNTGTYGAGSRGALMLSREDALTGVGGQMFWNNNSTSGQLQKYDGTNYTWTTGYLHIMSGTYETT